MPINKAVLAAFKAATRLRPDIREFYKTQRLAEDVSAKLVLPNPRCRIDEASALMPDGHARHRPVLPRRRLGERHG